MIKGNVVKSFEGEERFLSNFWPCLITWEGIEYPSVEHAYQAAKTLDPSTRTIIASTPSASSAKYKGKTFPLRPDWDNIKVGIMKQLLLLKFAPGTPLRGALEATIGLQLVEGNYWHDTFWGECYCFTHENVPGQKNMLGKLLMNIRDSSDEISIEDYSNSDTTKF